jgi:hypothetical protein
VTEERQRYADDRQQTDHHPDIDHGMKKQYRCYAEGNNSTIEISTASHHPEQSENEKAIESDDEQTAHEAPFLSNDRENEVSGVFRQKLKLGLCALNITFAEELP